MKNVTVFIQFFRHQWSHIYFNNQIIRSSNGSNPTGTYKVRNEIETKRNETKSTKTKRNETKSTKTKRNETKSTKWKRNETKPMKAKRNRLI
jgi:hypothetical protein